MISKADADLLIETQKKVIVSGKNVVDIYDLLIRGVLNCRINMVSFPEADYEFFMDIKQSAKNKIKLTLHIQSDDLNIPLLRIDYGGTHKNPEESDWFVPSEFERFTGKAFDVSTHTSITMLKDTV